MAGEIVFLGGLLNFVDPIFGLQMYIWSWIFGLFFCVVCWAAWYYLQWKPYEPLHGLYYGAKAGTNAAFTFGTQLYMELISEAEAKCIFNYRTWTYELPRSRLPARVQRFFFNYATAFIDDMPPMKAVFYKFAGVNMDVKIAKRMQNGEWEEDPSVTIGSVPTDLVLDADQWTQRDSPQHRLIEEQALAWNEKNPDDQVHSYSKYGRLIAEGRIAAPAGVQPEIVVPWIRIDSSFPRAAQDNEYDGWRRQTAKERAEAEQGAQKSMMMKILLACAAVAAVIFFFRFVSFWLSLKH